MIRRRCFRSLCAVVAVWPLMVSAQTVAPLHGTIGGGGAGGTGSVIGEAVVQVVRTTYPGSGLTYAPSSIASSLIAMLTGKVEYSVAAAGEMKDAISGAPPFRQSYPAENLSIVGNLLHPAAMVAVVYARREFVEDHGLTSLRDLRDLRAPVRLSTNTFGNVPTARHNRILFDVIGIDEALIEQRGGKDYHLPDTAGLGLLQDSKLDLIVTLGFHPDHRAVQAARAVPLVLLPFGDGVPDEMAKRLGTPVGVIPAGSYDFLEEDYEGSTMGGLFLAAGPKAEDDDTYRLARALYLGMERLKQVHRSFSTMEQDLLVETGGLPMHPAAARFYREVGLLPQQ